MSLVHLKNGCNNNSSCLWCCRLKYKRAVQGFQQHDKRNDDAGEAGDGESRLPKLSMCCCGATFSTNPVSWQ